MLQPQADPGEDLLGSHGSATPTLTAAASGADDVGDTASASSRPRPMMETVSAT